MKHQTSEVVCVGVPSPSAVRAVVQIMDHALHDLGQPLTSLALAMELLAAEQDKGIQQTMLDAARKECTRAIDDVAELRRLTLNLLHMAENGEKVGA